MASAGVWAPDWMWGAPLIALTVVMHVLGLGIISTALRRWFGKTLRRSNSQLLFCIVTATAALLLVLLHMLDALIWAAAYVMLSALPNIGDAVYFSLGAITTLGSDSSHLAKHWKLMGAIEAMDGLLLFGLSTAFLFAMLERIWIFQTELAGGRKHWADLHSGE